MKRIFNRVLFFCFIGMYIYGQGIKADHKLPFEVGPHTFSAPFSVYLGAGSDDAQNYALSHLVLDVLTPYAPESVTHNYNLKQKNPIYNKKINHLMLFRSTPLVVLADSSSEFHYILHPGSGENPMHVLSASTVADAAGVPSSGIIGLSWCQTSTSAEHYLNYLVAAVKPQQDSWGQVGSGIALIKYDQEMVQEPLEKKEEKANDKKKEKKDKKIQQPTTKTVAHPYFNILDAQTGQSKGNKAYTLAACVPPYVSILPHETIDLVWDDNFQRLYIPLHIKTNDTTDSNQGACAVLIGTICDDQLSLSPLIALEVFDENHDSVIGGAGANKTVSISKIRMMYTSTGLPYLVAVGNEGNADGMMSKVAAFPLTNMSDTKHGKELLINPDHGVIACKNEIPEARFLNGRYGRFRGRIFKKPARTKDDFYSMDDRSVRVGSYGVLPTAITELVVIHDCVFACVDQGNGQQAGVFYSQALFEPNGRIASWTSWKRVAHSSASIIDLNVELTKNNLIFFESNPPKIRACTWQTELNVKNNECKTVADSVRKEFPQGSGGAQGLFDFDQKTPGLLGPISSSLMVATGNKKVLLVQTGVDNDQGIFMPNDDFKQCTLLDGSLHAFNKDASVISITGGILDKLGPITCAEIVHDDTQAWLLVGGVGGVAVLSDEQGKGWPVSQGLGKNFAGLSQQFGFKKYGNYSSVKKIIQDEKFLYILTRDRLERLSICSDSFKNDFTCGAVSLATSEHMHVRFTDVLISGPFAVLGTTGGLFRISNNSSLWQHVDIPVSYPNIISLTSASPSGKDTGFAYDGQVYVLSGSTNTNETSVHRFFVKDVKQWGITDATLSLLIDYGVRDQISRFITFGGYRNNYVTDGLIHISTRGGSGKLPSVHVLPGFVGGKLVMSACKEANITTPWTDNSTVYSLVRNSADGSWLIAGDFGTCSYQY